MPTLLFALILAQSPATCIGPVENPCGVIVLPAPGGMVPAPVVQQIVESHQERKAGWLHAVIGANIVAHFIDISLTQYALGTGRFREANPILRGIGTGPVRMAVAKGSIAVGTSYLLIRHHKKNKKLTIGLGIASTVATGYIAARNARSLRHSRENRP